jgi:UDP-N-acetylmuramyl pentapeptide phosphotransferase/UDP-N-acetylglucosamine-1-phosphate transferase
MSIIFSFLIAVLLCKPEYVKRPEYSSVFLVLLIIMFLYGLGDDIFNFRPLRKLFIQILLCSIMVFKTKSYLPIENVNPLLNSNGAIFITILFMLLIVNSINLIDGADGVAGFLTLISSIYFSIYFFIDNNLFYFFISISLLGSILAFLFYNFPSAYIFMGDSGSLFVGMLLATLIIVYIEGGKSSIMTDNLNQRIVIGLASLSVPILDMMRLIVQRILKGKKPYVGDNNHIHHLLKNIGLNKKQVVLIIVVGQLFLMSVSILNVEKNLFFIILINASIYIFVIQVLQIITKKTELKIKMISEYEDQNSEYQIK